MVLHLQGGAHVARTPGQGQAMTDRLLTRLGWLVIILGCLYFAGSIALR